MSDFFSLCKSVDTDYTCTSAAGAGSVGTNPMTHPNGYDMSISLDSGFSGTVDVTCTHNSDSAVTAIHSMTLTIIDCSSVLSSPTSPESVSLAYDSSTNTEAIQITSTWTDWNTHFLNTDSTNCPITSCSLYD
jgi:hypothetical protein